MYGTHTVLYTTLAACAYTHILYMYMYTHNMKTYMYTYVTLCMHHYIQRNNTYGHTYSIQCTCTLHSSTQKSKAVLCIRTIERKCSVLHVHMQQSVKVIIKLHLPVPPTCKHRQDTLICTVLYDACRYNIITTVNKNNTVENRQ